MLEAPEPAPGAATESVAKRDRLWLVDGGDVDDMANLHRQGAEHGVRFSFDGPVTNSRSSLRLVLWARAPRRSVCAAAPPRVGTRLKRTIRISCETDDLAAPREVGSTRAQAQSLGRNEELMAALGWRHFGEDAPLSDPTTLLDSCVEAGLDRTAAAAVLAGDDYGDAVDASHAAWAGLRKLQGIPLCVFNCYHPHLDVSQRLRVSGSAPAAEHARVFREIERTAREPPTWRFAPAAKTRSRGAASFSDESRRRAAAGTWIYQRRRVAATPQPRREHSAETSRGDAAAGMWILRGGESRRGCGRDVDIP